jgi:TolA-binding protein
MKYRNKTALRGLSVLLMMLCLPGQAATVYRTVDESGVVSFSDTPPAGDAPVETMKINAATPKVSPEEQQQLEDMRETTDRMAADRREREKQRAELRQEQAQSNVAQQPDYTDYMDYSSGYNRVYRGPVRRPRLRPGNGARPVHPIARPPVRPPTSSARPTRPASTPRR